MIFPRFRPLLVNDEDREILIDCMDRAIGYWEPVFIRYKAIKRKPQQMKADELKKRIRAYKRLKNYLESQRRESFKP